MTKVKDKEHSKPEYVESDASEMDKESGENEDSGLSDQPPAKKSRKSENVPLPTVEEINEYKQVENLHHSSLFRMQINELLHEMKLSLIKSLRIEKRIEQLKKILLDLPQGQKYNLVEQNWVNNLGMCVPLIQNPHKVRGMFCFYPPKSVTIVGSFLQGTAIKNKSRIDVAVEMPQKFYQMKDFMNHRYIRKRALYLVTIANHLKEQPFVDKEMHFTYHKGDHFKPILVISLTDSKGRCCQVHIHAVPSTFQMSRFNFSKNNVRNTWFYGDMDDDKDTDEQHLNPTPLHNMSVMSDMVMLNNSKSVAATFGFDSSHLKDGIILLKIWLHQRQLSEGYGAFSTYIMLMFVVYLLRKKKLNKLMSSYQVFRTTLYNLANSDWIEQGITLLPVEKMQDGNIPKLEEFKGRFDVVFVDFTGYLNLTANMNRFTYLEVKKEAAITVKSLDIQQSGTFETIFMKNVPFHMRYDQIFHITDLSQFENEAKKPESSERFLDLGGHSIHTVTLSVLSFLQKVLNKRVSHIQMKPVTFSEWSVNESPPWVSDISTLTFGITIVEEHAYNVIEKGPAANLPEAKEFRAFWGDKSEMRKFSDSSICEAVLWTEGTTMAHKRSICSQIISYMLNKAYNISFKNICITENLFNPMLVENSNKKENSGTGEEEILKIISAYDKLCQLLRKCDLSIEIKDIQTTSPTLRFAEVFPPQPARYCTSYKKLDKRLLPDPKKPCPSLCPYFTVLCFMGSTKRNIEELDSLERLKAMCHLELQQSFRKDFYLPMSCNQNYLDVLLYGYVFRIKMCFSKEIDILKLTTTSDASQVLWGELRLLPKLTSLLHSLGLEHGSYSAVVRLAKRWVSAHMLSGYVPEVAVELIVAHLFLSPEPFQIPKSLVTGFNRFLQFLSTFDWETTPLLVDLNKEFAATDVLEIKKKFNTSRECLPPMCICTPVDIKSLSFWTRENPNRMILNRLRTTAQQCLFSLNEYLSHPKPQNDFKVIFRTSLEPFDMVLYLNTNQLGRPGQAVDSKYNSNKDKLELLTNNLPVVDYEPNQHFLKELKSTFSHVALFFHDPYGSNVIGIVWKPNFFNYKSFKVSDCNMQMVINSDKSNKSVETAPNIEAIIEDIKIMGKGILHDITLKTQSFLN